MNVFICYDGCSTCKKAEKWLKENNIEFTKRPIREERPSAKELDKWHKLSGLEIKKFFNANGAVYKSMELKNKLQDMTEKEMLTLLSTDGMLVKRPLLVTESRVLVGFKESEWEETLAGR